MHGPSRRTPWPWSLAACTALLLTFPPRIAAGDLNAEVNNMFNSLGAIGTLVPRRSLLKESAKQVGKDAATAAESAVDAVKDLLKRK